eukprot:gene25389-11053_t
MYYDDLPMWGFIGKVEKILLPGGEAQLRDYLFTHIDFDIKYNTDKVIEISISTDPARSVDITNATSVNVEFTYSVRWMSVTTPYENRLHRYEKFPLNPIHLEIHWFSIINSCITVLLLTGFLATILMRVLKADFVKFSVEDAVADEDEAGWKYLHGDVFRFPGSKSLFCALIGTGTQIFYLSFYVFALALIFYLSFFVFALALVGVFYPYNRGGLYTAVIILYACTASIAGYVAASYYKQMGGEQWVPYLASSSAGPSSLCFHTSTQSPSDISRLLPCLLAQSSLSSSCGLSSQFRSLCLAASQERTRRPISVPLAAPTSTLGRSQRCAGTDGQSLK